MSLEKPLRKKFFGVNGDTKSSVESGMRKGQLNWVKCLILDPEFFFKFHWGTFGEEMSVQKKCKILLRQPV